MFKVHKEINKESCVGSLRLILYNIQKKIDRFDKQVSTLNHYVQRTRNYIKNIYWKSFITNVNQFLYLL